MIPQILSLMNLNINQKGIINSAFDSMITNDFFLSVCIPTYNRIDKTLSLVESILEYEGTDIEVVVVDNCSTDHTGRVLGNIKDKRFRYLRNKEAIGGMPNILTSLTYGRGEYVLLCLDKDRILPEKIQEFITRLQKYDLDIVGGQCSINTSDSTEDLIYNDGLESVLNFAYTSEHPSGLFIKNNLLKQSEIIQHIVTKYTTFAFLPELLKAEIALSGRTARINMPFVYTETLEECEKEISHTYKGENIYFFPKNIINTFNIYCENLFNLKITKKDKIIILKRIFLSLLSASTFGFNGIMKNKSICSHHGIHSRNVSIKELIQYAYGFSKSFLSSKIPISVFCKIYICAIANLKMAFVITRNKFKK